MKTIILIFLILTSVILPQAKKSVLTDAQRDSIQAMIDASGGGSLPDSVLTSSDSTDQRTFSDAKYVDKSSTQTITGAKNFSSQLKTLGTNTNISLDENWIGFFRNTTAEVPYGIAWLDSAENTLWTSGMDYEGSDLSLVWDGRTSNDVLRVSTGGIWTMGHIAGSPALGGAQVQIVGDTSLTTYIQSWDIYAGSQRTNYGAINQDGFFSFPYSVVDTFQTYFTGIGYPMDETANSLKFGKITAPTTITDQYILMNLTASGTYNDLTNSGTKYGNYIQSSFGSLVLGIAAPESAFVPIAMVGLDSTFNILGGSELALYNSGNTSIGTIKLDANNDISLNNISNGIVNNIVGGYTINSYNTISQTYIPAFRIFTNQTIGINGASDSTLTVTGSGHFTTNLQIDGTIDANTILVNGSPIENSSTVIDLALAEIQTWADTAGYESAFTGAEIDKAIGNTLYSVIKTNPDSATAFTLLRTKAEIVIDSVFALVQGTSALVDFNLAYGTNRTSGTNVFGSSQSADNVTVGETFSTFSSATIPVNNMLWLNITNTDNTPEEFLCVIYYH